MYDEGYDEGLAGEEADLGTEEADFGPVEESDFGPEEEADLGVIEADLGTEEE